MRVFEDYRLETMSASEVVERAVRAPVDGGRRRLLRRRRREALFEQDSPFSQETAETVPPRIFTDGDVASSFVHRSSVWIVAVDVEPQVVVSPQTRRAFAFEQHGAGDASPASVRSNGDVAHVRHARFGRWKRFR